MIKKIISAVGTVASIVSLGFITCLPPTLRILFVIIGFCSLAYLLFEAVKSSRTNETICHNDVEIKKVMKRIIESYGKICIMSRDLSWVDREMEACIKKKKDNMLIFAEKESELTRRLSSYGVTVKYYGHLDFVPKTRFTIIRYNRTNPQVAIANTQNSIRKRNKFKHVIYETLDSGSQQDKWINSLALDMISLCLAVAKEGKHD